MAESEATTWAAIARLDTWLESMRGSDGYGGPVVHWWQDCLLYTGAGLDWRYEGIILSYLALHAKTGARGWLAKARRAGDDLLSGQLASGHYRASSFEQNPYPGGTPHEAACDLALLHLAEALRDERDPGAEAYLEAAERNLRDYYVRRLWDAEAEIFLDQVRKRTFVPNKAATLAEAWLMLARLRDDDEPALRYGMPTLEAVLQHQVGEGPLDGAIDQGSEAGQPMGRFFPYYVARCVPGLVSGYEWEGQQRHLDAAVRALGFVMGCQYADGSFPQVVYANGHRNRYPQWVAGVGDILRAASLLRAHGLAFDTTPARAWLLGGQAANGGFRTARGFGSQVSQREPGLLPEFQDVLPVAGWTDKAFRYLASTVEASESSPPTDEASSHLETACTYCGERMHFYEDGAQLAVRRDGGAVLYQWRKGEPWARVAAPAMWLN